MRPNWRRCARYRGSNMEQVHTMTHPMTDAVTIRPDAIRVVKIVLMVVSVGLGLLFVGIGAGMFFGFTVPENRDAAIARNVDYPQFTATVTNFVPSTTTVNNELMYRIYFTWNDGANTYRSRAVYTRAEAAALVNQQIQIRVAPNGRAVPADFTNSPLSLLGYVFLGVFGGIGVASLIGAVCIMVLVRPNRARQTAAI